MNKDDLVVQEVRRIRQEHAAHFNYDLWAIVADLKRSEAARDGSKSPLLEPSERPAAPSSTGVQRTRFARR